jgi:hypothetical protein
MDRDGVSSLEGKNKDIVAIAGGSSHPAGQFPPNFQCPSKSDFSQSQIFLGEISNLC